MNIWRRRVNPFVRPVRKRELRWKVIRLQASANTWAPCRLGTKTVHIWARGYWVASSGNVTDEVWMEYIKNQVRPEPDDNFKVT